MSAASITPKGLHEVLTLTLEPRQPSEAELIYAYSEIAQTSTGAYMGFHFWAAGIDPASEAPYEQLASYLNAPPTNARSNHVHRVCLSLSVYARGSDLPTTWRERDQMSILFLLWAALTCPSGPTVVMQLCNRAFDVNPNEAATSDLYFAALRRMATPISPEEATA